MKALARRPVVWFAVAAAACSIAGVLGFRHGHPRPLRGDFPLASLVTAWSGWDGEWYVRIATGGYEYFGPNTQSQVAFFPGYPLLVRGLWSLGLNPYVAGTALTLAAGAIAAVLFHRWALRVGGDASTAGWATALLLGYPLAFYLYGVVYSDALFLVLALGAFVSLEEGHPGRATLLGALATATRPVAPAIVLGLLVRQVELRRRAGQRLRPIDALLLLAASGTIAYAAYLGSRFGDPIAFAHVQGAPGWDQAPGLHTWLKISWLEVLSQTLSPMVALRFIGHAYVALFGLLLVIPTARRVGWGYAAYQLVAFGIPAVSTKDFMGVGRYAVAGFPIFLTLALLLREQPRVRVGWIAASVLGLLALAYAFGTGAYVA